MFYDDEDGTNKRNLACPKNGESSENDRGKIELFEENTTNNNNNNNNENRLVEIKACSSSSSSTHVVSSQSNKKKLEDLRDVLSCLERRCRELKHISAAGYIAEIRNYSEHLRNDIEIITQSVLEYVNRFHDKLMNQVTAYEKECIENIKNKADDLKNFQKLLLAVETFRNEWLKKMTTLEKTSTMMTKNDNDDEPGSVKNQANREYDETSISMAVRTGKQHLKTLQLEEVKQKRIKFNEKILVFKDNYEWLTQHHNEGGGGGVGAGAAAENELDNESSCCAKLLGELVYTTKIKPVNNQFVDLIDLTRFGSPLDRVCVEKLANEMLVVVSTNRIGLNSKLVLMMGCEPWTIVSEAELSARRLDAVFTSHYQNTVYACLVVNFESSIHAFDGNKNNNTLDTLASTTIAAHSPINSFASNSTQILAWSSIGSKIHSFSHTDLRPLRTIALNALRPDLPFYMPRFVCHMHVDERHLYLLDYDSNVCVMTLEGDLVRRFEIANNSETVLYSDTSSDRSKSSMSSSSSQVTIIAYDLEKCRLVYYDINSGKQVGERKLGVGGLVGVLPGDLALVNCSNLSGELFMLSSSEKSIYVFLA